jgi:uncharacterized protein (TIGR02270 family)
LLNTNIFTPQKNAYRNICEQFVIDASFLWVLRSINVKQPHYNSQDLFTLEQRIDANLDGAMCHFELAWDICLQELAYEQAGETFTAAIIAFRSRDIDKIKYIVDHAFINEQTFKGLLSALAWLPKNLISEWLERFLYSKDLNHKYLAVALCSVRRKNPGEILKELLQREDCLAHEKLLARVIRLIGELKLYAFANNLQQLSEHELPEIQFWSNWSLIMLGEHHRAENLIPYINNDFPFQQLAIETTFKVLSIEKSRNWISQFSQQKQMTRAVIRATGILGDPHVIPWLIDKMSHFETAKIAGEAFTLITGIDLERYELSIDPPEDIISVPNDDIDDENVDLDEDENLSFPDINKINHTWLRYRDRYKPGSCYVMGVEVKRNSAVMVEKLNATLKHAGQRQRVSIALTLALLDPQSPFVNVNARSLV